jgi:hypothetical protein
VYLSNVHGHIIPTFCLQLLFCCSSFKQAVERPRRPREPQYPPFLPLLACSLWICGPTHPGPTHLTGFYSHEGTSIRPVPGMIVASTVCLPLRASTSPPSPRPDTSRPQNTFQSLESMFRAYWSLRQLLGYVSRGSSYLHCFLSSVLHLLSFIDAVETLPPCTIISSSLHCSPSTSPLPQAHPCRPNPQTSQLPQPAPAAPAPPASPHSGATAARATPSAAPALPTVAQAASLISAPATRTTRISAPRVTDLVGVRL